MSRIALLLPTALLVVTTSIDAHAQTTAAHVVAGIQARYALTTDIKGKFKQTFRDSLYNSQRVSYGCLYAKRPSMARWEYVKPSQKAFITNGRRLWVWVKQHRQVFVSRFPAGANAALSFMLGSAALSRQYTAAIATGKLAQIAKPGDIALQLTPRIATATYQHAVLSVNARTFQITRVALVNNQSENRFDLSQLQHNTRLSSARFNFAIPAGVRVIRSGAAQRPVAAPTQQTPRSRSQKSTKPSH